MYTSLLAHWSPLVYTNIMSVPCYIFLPCPLHLCDRSCQRWSLWRIILHLFRLLIVLRVLRVLRILRVFWDPLGTNELELSQLFVFAGLRVLSDQEEALIPSYSVPDHQPSVTSHHSCPNLSRSESWICLIAVELRSTWQSARRWVSMYVHR